MAKYSQPFCAGRHYITLHVIQLTRLSKATHNFVEGQNAEISTNDIQRDVFGSLYGLHVFHNSHFVYVCPLSRTPGISGGRGSDKRSNRRKKRDGSQTLPRKYMSLGICAFLFHEWVQRCGTAGGTQPCPLTRTQRSKYFLSDYCKV